MALRSALYYPYTAVRSPAFLRDALFLWDKLEVIVPWEGFGGELRRGPSPLDEAFEVFGVRRVPQPDEQHETYALVRDLLRYGTPTSLLRNDVQSVDRDFEVWGRKFNRRTWEALEEAAVARLRETDARLSSDREAVYHLDPAIALTMMAMLADVMAGKTRARVTDATDAYTAIANFPTRPWDHRSSTTDETFVVGRARRAVGLDRVPLSRMIALRRDEERDPGLRDMRHALLDRVEEQANSLNQPGLSPADRAEINRVFEARIESDLGELKRRLNFARREAILSTEVMALAVLVGTGVAALAAATPLPSMELGGSILAVGGPLLVQTQFASRRAEILREHPSAYLYAAGRRRRPMFNR